MKGLLTPTSFSMTREPPVLPVVLLLRILRWSHVEEKHKEEHPPGSKRCQAISISPRFPFAVRLVFGILILLYS